MSLRVAIAFILAFSAAAASAQLYRWTDQKGRVHITDTPPPASARNVQRINAAANTGVATQTPYEVSQAVENFPVTLYTSPACDAPCASARSALNQRGVPFKEVQVWDQATNEELKRVSGATDVPTLLVGRSVHVGFEQGAFDALLDSARYPKAGAVPARSQPAPAPPEGYVAQGGRTPAAETEAPAASGPYTPRPPRPGRQ